VGLFSIGAATGLPKGEAGAKGRLCALYNGNSQLRRLLLSQFAAGIEAGELCLYMGSGISADDIEALRLPPKHGDQIEIAERHSWLNGCSAHETMVDLRLRKEQARAAGYVGLRVVVDLGRLSGSDLRAFLQSADCDTGTAGHDVLVLKAFAVANLSAADVLDILAAHEGVLVPSEAGWHVLGPPAPGGRDDVLAVQEQVEQARAHIAQEAYLGQAVLNALPAPIYTIDASGRITFCNEAAHRFAGRQIRMGEDKWCIGHRHFHTDMRAMAPENCPTAAVLQTGQAVQEAEFIIERPDGSFVPVAAYPSPLRDAAGALVGVVTMLVDVSARERAEELQRNLVCELNHRVKNALATVQALASQTIRDEGIALEVRKTFEGRLLALSRTHGHLSRAGWGSADLHAVLTDILSPFAPGRTAPVRLEGDDVRLPPQYMLTMGLVLHELASNASRFGALSVPGGKIVICWDQRTNEDGMVLHLHWQEEGGPAVHAPVRRGFGCRFIEHSISHLDGRASLYFNAEGLDCDIEIPVKRCAGEAEWLNALQLGLAEGRHGPAH